MVGKVVIYADYHLQQHCSAFQPHDWIESEQIHTRYIIRVATIEMLHYNVIQGSGFVDIKPVDSW